MSLPGELCVPNFCASGLWNPEVCTERDLAQRLSFIIERAVSKDFWFLSHHHTMQPDNWNKTFFPCWVFQNSHLFLKEWIHLSWLKHKQKICLAVVNNGMCIILSKSKHVPPCFLCLQPRREWKQQESGNVLGPIPRHWGWFRFAARLCSLTVQEILCRCLRCQVLWTIWSHWCFPKGQGFLISVSNYWLILHS